MKQRQRPKQQYPFEYDRLPCKESDNSDEETELFVKNSYKEIPTTEKAVEENDTLQALAIRYQCSISELKRLNTIHRDNEIFAKRTIKVPLRPFSMALASVHGSGTNSPQEKTVPAEEIDAKLLKKKLCNNFLDVSSSSTDLNGVEVNTVIFNSNLKPVARSFDTTIENPIVNEISEEEIRLLPRTETPETIVLKLSCSGADADISWIALIVCIVIVIVAVPLIYVFYIYEHPEKFHHDHDHNS